MYSRLFCGSLGKSFSKLNLKSENDQDIKLYKIELLKYQESVCDLSTFLSPSERDRSDRYHFEKDRNRFIICRTLLKILLAEYTGLETDKITLESDANKKPYLASHPYVFFNVAHSGDYALIAIAKSPIGIDIEYVNKSFDYTEILPNIFNEIEIEEVDKSPTKHLAFYDFWTRKEAIVKAIGKGIDDDFSKTPVTNGFHSMSSSLVGNIKEIKVFSFHVNEDYVGALAITDDRINLNEITFNPLPTSTELKSLTHHKKI